MARRVDFARQEKLVSGYEWPVTDQGPPNSVSTSFAGDLLLASCLRARGRYFRRAAENQSWSAVAFRGDVAGV